MIVTPIPDKNNLGRSYVRINDIPCFFPRHTATPHPHLDVEVMITGVHYFLDDDGNPDKTRPKQLFLRVVTPYYVEMAHTGFQAADGSVSARTYYMDNRASRMILPGRTGVRTDGEPGFVFVRRRDAPRDVIRAEGVADLKDLECHKFFESYQPAV